MEPLVLLTVERELELDQILFKLSGILSFPSHMIMSRFPVSFGLVSGSGGMSLVLPTWSPKKDNPKFSSANEYFTGRIILTFSFMIFTKNILRINLSITSRYHETIRYINDRIKLWVILDIIFNLATQIAPQPSDSLKERSL